MNRLGHGYVMGAVSGTAVIITAIVAFMVLISFQALRDWPAPGLNFGLGPGDSGGSISRAHALATGGTPVSAPVVAPGQVARPGGTSNDARAGGTPGSLPSKVVGTADVAHGPGMGSVGSGSPTDTAPNAAEAPSQQGSSPPEAAVEPPTESGATAPQPSPAPGNESPPTETGKPPRTASPTAPSVEPSPASGHGREKESHGSSGKHSSTSPAEETTPAPAETTLTPAEMPPAAEHANGVGKGLEKVPPGHAGRD